MDIPRWDNAGIVSLASIKLDTYHVEKSRKIMLGITFILANVGTRNDVYSDSKEIVEQCAID